MHNVTTQTDERVKDLSKLKHGRLWIIYLSSPADFKKEGMIFHSGDPSNKRSQHYVSSGSGVSGLSMFSDTCEVDPMDHRAPDRIGLF